MSTMVMCADQPPAPGMFQRCQSPAINYPFNGFGYGATGAQHPQDYNQFQIPEHGVQHAWYNAMYGARTDDWAYGPGPGVTSAGVMTSTPTAMGSYPYRSMGLDYSQPAAGQMSSDSPADTSSSSSSSGSPSNKQLRPPYDWMKKAAYQSAPTTGKTRTKDKYRVVYSDHQRLELEKEFHYSRYITIRRKAELAQNLALSERQVKIWFQNRRAKERKQNKKREESQLIKISGDLGDMSEESKQHVQQHMNMQMGTHAQHQVQVTSPSPKPIHSHNPYAYQGQGHGGQVHLSPQNALSPPHGHMTHQNQQYSSPNSLQLPVSPGNDVTATPQSCSVSPQPIAIKADIDAVDPTSTP